MHFTKIVGEMLLGEFERDGLSPYNRGVFPASIPILQINYDIFPIFGGRSSQLFHDFLRGSPKPLLNFQVHSVFLGIFPTYTKLWSYVKEMAILEAFKEGVYKIGKKSKMPFQDTHDIMYISFIKSLHNNSFYNFILKSLRGNQRILEFPQSLKNYKMMWKKW